MWGGNFAPTGWAFCNGQLLSIAQNTALFSLLGTTYGGDGVTTFGLPNLQGRMPMHWGNGPGLSPRVLGEKSGEETVTLNTTQIPMHSHPQTPMASGVSSTANATTPAGNFPAPISDPNSGSNLTAYSTTANGSSGIPANPSANTGAAGGSQPHDNMPPYLCVSFIIATTGIYPSRP